MIQPKVPIWIYALQTVLCLILLEQAVSYWQMNYWGDFAVTASQKREILELAGRTTAMFLVGVLVMLSQNPHYFVPLFLLNIFRETQETFIDAMYETDTYPWVNILVHAVIIALEVLALVKVYKISTTHKFHRQCTKED
ncbi:MAG: hypothetical protein JNN12_07285 [Bacteroidetes Order II. Incertae sedis bacterium]|nr:hypothetical protein [Bacteroidetes Order II. bacterium]